MILSWPANHLHRSIHGCRQIKLTAKRGNAAIPDAIERLAGIEQRSLGCAGPERRDTSMSPYELRARIEREKEPAPEKRQHAVPLAVVCLALYEVVKAGVFMLIFMQIWAEHEKESAVGNMAYDPVLTEPRFLLFPIAVIVFLGIAWGIWKLQPWARHAALGVPAVLAFYWWRPGAQLDIVPWVFKQPNFVTAVFLFELTSIAALYLLTDVTDAFEQAAKVRQT